MVCGFAHLWMLFNYAQSFRLAMFILDVIRRNIYSDVTFWNLGKWMVKLHMWPFCCPNLYVYLNPSLGERLLPMANFLVSFLCWPDFISACTCKLWHESRTRMLNTKQELGTLTPSPCTCSCCASLRPGLLQEDLQYSGGNTKIWIETPDESHLPTTE